jgi:hypothetical protein
MLSVREQIVFVPCCYESTSKIVEFLVMWIVRESKHGLYFDIDSQVCYSAIFHLTIPTRSSPLQTIDRYAEMPFFFFFFFLFFLSFLYKKKQKASSAGAGQ